MNVRELREALEGLDPEALVTIVDQHYHVRCHIGIRGSEDPWTVLIESTGRVVTEEDVS